MCWPKIRAPRRFCSNIMASPRRCSRSTNSTNTRCWTISWPKIASVEMAGLVSGRGHTGISDPVFVGAALHRRRHRRRVFARRFRRCCPPWYNRAFLRTSLCSRVSCPYQKGRQTTWLRLKDEERTVVLYESPHRLLKALEEICEFVSPDREVAVCRELSKKFEETKRGKASEGVGLFQKKKE